MCVYLIPDLYIPHLHLFMCHTLPQSLTSPSHSLSHLKYLTSLIYIFPLKLHLIGLFFRPLSHASKPQTPPHPRPGLGELENGCKTSNGPPLDEIIPVYRRDCHKEVYCGSHVYPGRGVYLLKFDNSYSLWRSKTLYYRVYYTE